VSPSPQPSYDYEAERQEQQRREQKRQRQEEELRRQEEERQRREAEEAKRRQEEFDRNKNQALRDMKGIAAGEFGLKGVETTDSFGLKGLGDPVPVSSGLKDPAKEKREPECKWGDQGSSVVDLRCLGLDPDKPVKVDPHVVRGQERVFPAQIDPATFKNANYNKGFEALMRTTFSSKAAADAVAYFKAAQLQRPNDPMVRNGLGLAQDILKARQQRDKDNQTNAAYLAMQGHAALMMGDMEKARGLLVQARQLDPTNSMAKTAGALAEVKLNEPSGAYQPQKDAYRLVSNSLYAATKQNFSAAVGMLEAAQRLQPGDKVIAAYLAELRKYAGVRSLGIHN
jgi:hypothetical protein